MADYGEFAPITPKKEWEERYQKHGYSEAYCYRCGALINRIWGITRHDEFHKDLQFLRSLINPSLA